MHKIILEDNAKTSIKHQRRLNPVMKDVLKWLNASFIYAISNIPWVSPIHVVPKKGRFTVIRNEKNELIYARTMTGWRLCIDYKKSNTATGKDHYPLPYIDKMLDRLVGHPITVFLMDILVIIRLLQPLRIRSILHLHVLMAFLLSEGFHLEYIMLPPPSKSV